MNDQCVSMAFNRLKFYTDPFSFSPNMSIMKFIVLKIAKLIFCVQIIENSKWLILVTPMTTEITKQDITQKGYTVKQTLFKIR